MLSWLPLAPDFARDLRAAVDCAGPSERRAKLAALARHRLGFMETLLLDRALGTVEEEQALPPVRLGLLASSTADHLPPSIRVAGLRRDLPIDVHVGPYGQHRQQLVDPGSSLHRFAPHYVLLALTSREALSSTSVAADRAEIDASIARTVGELRSLWAKARRAGAVVIQQTFLDVAEPLFGSYERLVPSAPSSLVGALNDAIARVAEADDVLLLDVARAAERAGRAAWFDVALWLQAKIEIAHSAAPLYGELVARVIAAQRGLSRKCLVLDLDNTLWGGVVGDDGIEGIVLGEGTAGGEAHLALQRYVKRLGERGVILAVCSKNDPDTAEAAFRNHPEMHLRRSDIAAFVANWNDKAANLVAIAEELNVGLESLVFVDDNPVERARVRETLPIVAVPELPDDVAHYPRCLADAGYFEAVAFTPEDRRRGEQYAANARRNDFMAAAQGLDDFLLGLDMSVSAASFQPVDLARVVQLINKTNQFNPTTRRRSAQEIAALAADGCLTLQLRLLDRFGDNGLVGAMILRPIDDTPDVLDIDTWVMSCRVFGRELEHETMNIAVESAREAGARALRAEYIPTAKNAVVRELYPTLGFVPEPADGLERGGTRWLLPLRDYVPRRTHIRRLPHPS
jgi:FkbH-like protein